MNRDPRFALKLIALSVAFFAGNTSLYASDFNIPFISAADLGTAFADWATGAKDATTAYSNPAGLTKIKHEQLVQTAIVVKGNSRFTGTTVTPSFPFPFPVRQQGSASTGIGAFIPSVYFAKPINEQVTFGLHLTTPFGLGTNYGKTSIVRYASTRAQVADFDFGPDAGYQVSKELSLGAGLDINYLLFSLNSMNGVPFSKPDAENHNLLKGYGLGWHAGLLYEPLIHTRVGLSFNSMVSVRSKGYSITYLPNGVTYRTSNNKSNERLPARTQLSLQQSVNDSLDVMGTIFYTNWRSFNKITMQNLMTTTGATRTVSVPFNYHNTFDYSVGLAYKANEKWILRTGVQYMNAPSNNQDRGIANPVGRATMLALGARYQQNQQLSYDFAYSHSFFNKESVNLINPLTMATGYHKAQTNMYGIQVNWNMT